MSWTDYVSQFLDVHAALHRGDKKVHTSGKDYSIEVSEAPTKDFATAQLDDGWSAVTQNMMKPSPNTASVKRAREAGGDHQITWVFDRGGYRGRIDTVIDPEGNETTMVTDLKTHEIVYKDPDTS
jgi:hypothetical protein